jgi:hypothetical protein
MGFRLLEVNHGACDKLTREGHFVAGAKAIHAKARQAAETVAFAVPR